MVWFVFVAAKLTPKKLLFLVQCDEISKTGRTTILVDFQVPYKMFFVTFSLVLFSSEIVWSSHIVNFSLIARFTSLTHLDILASFVNLIEYKYEQISNNAEYLGPVLLNLKPAHCSAAQRRTYYQLSWIESLFREIQQHFMH